MPLHLIADQLRKGLPHGAVQFTCDDFRLGRSAGRPARDQRLATRMTILSLISFRSCCWLVYKKYQIAGRYGRYSILTA